MNEAARVVIPRSICEFKRRGVNQFLPRYPVDPMSFVMWARGLFRIPVISPVRLTTVDNALESVSLGVYPVGSVLRNDGKERARKAWIGSRQRTDLPFMWYEVAMATGNSPVGGTSHNRPGGDDSGGAGR